MMTASTRLEPPTLLGRSFHPPAGSDNRMVIPQTALRILCHRTGGTISRSTFYRWLSSGKIPSIRLGTRIFIPWQAIEELIRKCYDPD